MDLIASVAGIWYLAAGILLLASENQVAGVAFGFLLATAGSAMAASSFRAARGSEQAAKIVRRSSWTVLAVVAAAAAAWGFHIVFTGAYSFTRITARNGAFLYFAGVVVPAVMALLAIRKGSRSRASDS